MFPSYKSLKDKREKLKAYYDQIKYDEEIDNLKKQAYANAYFSDQQGVNLDNSYQYPKAMKLVKVAPESKYQTKSPIN